MRKTTMTIAEIQQRVGGVARHAERGDEEGARVLESELHREVLEAIADGWAEDLMGAAAAALKTKLVFNARSR